MSHEQMNTYYTLAGIGPEDCDPEPYYCEAAGPDNTACEGHLQDLRQGWYLEGPGAALGLMACLEAGSLWVVEVIVGDCPVCHVSGQEMGSEILRWPAFPNGR